MKIGILALQGAFAEHEKILRQVGVSSFEIRQKRDLKTSFDGLIIPGGESTVQGKLLRELELFQPLRALIDGGFPVYGTCAGLILLAKKVLPDGVSHLATMNITAVRNAYGRQLGSFYTEEVFQGIGKVPKTFIRAPYIESVWGEAEILACSGGHIVAARQGSQLVTAFHPELSSDPSVHKYFIDMVRNHSGRL